MIKCLFIMQDWDGGAEIITLNLVKNLDRSLIDPVICSTNYLPQLAEKIPENQQFFMPEKPGIISASKNFIKICQMAKKCDLVIGTLQLKSVFLASLVAPKKNIAWLHNDLQGKLKNKSSLFKKIYISLLAWALKRSIYAVCVSEGVKNSYALIWPTLSNSLKVIWNPLDIKAIRKKSNDSLPASLEQCFTKPVIISIGRLEHQKNFPLLLEACSLLWKRGVDFNLCIVGQGSQEKELKNIARTLEIEDKVYFAGYLQNPYPALANSSVLALSSNHEGFGNVLIEALCVGIPVVSTNCPSGPDEILCSGKYGILVPMNDPHALAAALEKSLLTPPDPEKIAAGKKRAEEFDLTLKLAAWQDLIIKTAASIKK